MSTKSGPPLKKSAQNTTMNPDVSSMQDNVSPAQDAATDNSTTTDRPKVMTPAERQALINAPFPSVRVYGGRTFGGGETYPRDERGDLAGQEDIIEIARRRAMHGRRPSLSDYEGGS